MEEDKSQQEDTNTVYIGHKTDTEVRTTAATQSGAPPTSLPPHSPEEEGAQNELQDEDNLGLIGRLKRAIPVSVLLAIGVFTLVASFLVMFLLMFSQTTPRLNSKKVNPEYAKRLNQCKDSEYYNRCLGDISEYITAPNSTVFIVVGLVLIVLTTILLVFIKSKIGFRWAWVVLAAIYNAVIIVMKFFISPSTLYGTKFTIETGSAQLDPNNGFSIFLAAIGIFFLYLLVLTVVYKVYKKLVVKDLHLIESKKETKKPKLQNRTKIIIFAAVAVMAVISGMGIFVIFFGIGPTVGYITYLPGYIALLILTALAFLVGAFSNLRSQIRETKNIALLASFFFVAFCLIISIHAIWVVFMALLALLWPFNVTYYSSK